MAKPDSELVIKLHSSLDIILTSGVFIWAYFIKNIFFLNPYGA